MTDNEDTGFFKGHKPNYSFDSICPNENINDSGTKAYQDMSDSLRCSLLGVAVGDGGSVGGTGGVMEVEPNKNSYEYKAHQYGINSFNLSLSKNHINNNSNKKKTNVIDIAQNINSYEYKAHQDKINSIDNSLPKIQINKVNSYKKVYNNLSLACSNTHININSSVNKPHQDKIYIIDNSSPKIQINNDNSNKKVNNNNDNSYKIENNNLSFVCPNNINNSYKKVVNKINLIWIDPNKSDCECKAHQGGIMNKFNIFFKTQTEEAISQIKEFKFKKTYILINESISEEFFSLLNKAIDEIEIFPVVIVYTNGTKLDIIKIINLKKFYFFDMNLVFDEFNQVRKQLLLENKYQPNHKQVIECDNFDNCFTFQYIKESKDLIMPLIFMELIAIPSQIDILEFNKFLLDKDYDNVNQELYELIEQLITYQKIPLSILIKYWIRAYTIESQFYKEMNFTLMKELNNDFEKL